MLAGFIALLLAVALASGIAAADQASFGPYGCASVDGDASCSQGVALSVFGHASTGSGDAYYEGSAAVSVLGDARGGDLAFAPTGAASSPGGVAVTVLGPADGWWAVAPLGSASGAWAMSVAGSAQGRFLAASVLGDAAAADCAFLAAPVATLPCGAVSVTGRAHGPVAVSACNAHEPACLTRVSRDDRFVDARGVVGEAAPWRIRADA